MPSRFLHVLQDYSPTIAVCLRLCELSWHDYLANLFFSSCNVYSVTFALFMAVDRNVSEMLGNVSVPLIVRLKHPSLSPESESAPHCSTTALGWYISITLAMIYRQTHTQSEIKNTATNNTIKTVENHSKSNQRQQPGPLANTRSAWYCVCLCVYVLLSVD